MRQLIQHEDYAMRLFGDAGLPTARSVGIVELTPEREYLLVTEFFDGAEEIGDAEVDDQIIDEGLALLRQLWNAGDRPSRHQARQPPCQGRPPATSSTSPSPRSARPRGGRRSTSPT